MAADGHAFGVSFAIYLALAVLSLLFFGAVRRAKICRKFFAPLRHTKGLEHRPKRLPKSFWGWIPPVYTTPLEEVIRVSGFDAAMYMKLISFGTELFLWLTVWCCITVLPTNIVGKEVVRLSAPHVSNQPNRFTYWVPPPPPPSPPSATPSPPAPIKPTETKPPNFYDSTPPAPPGLEWWQYRADVPPLPDPGTLLGPEYAHYGWRYDKNYQTQNYKLSNMDLVRKGLQIFKNTLNRLKEPDGK